MSDWCSELQLMISYRADGMYKSVCDLISAHVSVNVECSRQLLPQM